jgi:ATP-dependent Clp protease ATP-binding subunit ClpC
MFERYTESARRALFFARYEVSERGGPTIDTEHLLLGLIRDLRGLIGRILDAAGVSPHELRKDIEARIEVHEKIPTSVEIPFSDHAKRALEAAAGEADRLGHRYIGTEHLLLGLLREEGSVAETVLTGRGLRLEQVRDLIVKVLAEHPPADPQGSAMSVGLLQPAYAFELIRTTRDLVDQLAALMTDEDRAATLVDLIRQRLDELERLLGL